MFLDEFAVGLKHLHAIGLAITHVNQPIVRALHAMHRVAELLGRRCFRVIVALLGIVGLVAVGAPVAFHLAGVGIEHRHTLVLITIRDIGFIGFRIDPDFCHAAEMFEAVAAGILAVGAHLQQELSILGEFQQVRIALAVAAQPHVALVIDMHAVRALRPLVALSRPAP